MNESRKPKVFKADRSLQHKIGTGTLNAEDVKKMQDAIDNNDFDFSQIGMKFLHDLKAAIDDIKKSQSTDLNEYRSALINPVMQLKANAAIFKYNLIGDLANVMLSFLESIDELDKDAVAIVHAHHSTLNAIISKNMKGDAGDVGKLMVTELRDACNRYYAKRKT